MLGGEQPRRKIHRTGPRSLPECCEQKNFSLKQIDDDHDEKVPGDEEGNETPEQLRTYFTLNDNLKPVGVRRQLIVSLEQY